MPGWVVALLVALVGLAGAVLGTYVRIVHERSAEIRTRMLDAADSFVTAMTSASDAFDKAQLKVGVWAHISRMPGVDELLAAREQEGAEAHDVASTAWSIARERVPRIGLLFGVDDPAALLAVQASDELGEAVVALTRLRSEVYDSELEEEAIQELVPPTSRRAKSRPSEIAKIGSLTLERAGARPST